MNQPSYVMFRKHTFLSSAATGFSAIVITLVLSATAMFVYTVRVAGDKSERVIALAQSALKGLPELTQSLPPALADMLDDQRRPDYCKGSYLMMLAENSRRIGLPGAFLPICYVSDNRFGQGGRKWATHD
ncbi:MAG: hypothetical protein FJ280_31175, partial [Planctomycetes bacterium]|nr:hypothetical protein [Planctomycetota bacterium]